MPHSSLCDQDHLNIDATDNRIVIDLPEDQLLDELNRSQEKIKKLLEDVEKNSGDSFHSDNSNQSNAESDHSLHNSQNSDLSNSPNSPISPLFFARTKNKSAKALAAIGLNEKRDLVDANKNTAMATASKPVSVRTNPHENPIAKIFAKQNLELIHQEHIANLKVGQAADAIFDLLTQLEKKNLDQNQLSNRLRMTYQTLCKITNITDENTAMFENQITHANNINALALQLDEISQTYKTAQPQLTNELNQLSEKIFQTFKPLLTENKANSEKQIIEFEKYKNDLNMLHRQGSNSVRKRNNEIKRLTKELEQKELRIQELESKLVANNESQHGSASASRPGLY